MIKGKNIFITGGLGFIGSSLCSRLVRHNAITVFDNAKRNAFQYFDLYKEKNIKVVGGDVRNKTLLKKAIGDCDMVVHLAAIAGVSSYYSIPLETMEVNIMGTYNLLDILKNKKISRFVDFSTSEVYGVHAAHVKESNPTSQGKIDDPRWCYSISKLASEKLSYCFKWKYELPIVTVRPFNIYGPGQVGEGAIQIFVNKALRDEEINVTGNGKQVRAWCYIEDMLDGLLSCLERKEAIGQTFNIGKPDEPVTTLDLAKKIIKLTHSSSKIKFVSHLGTDIETRIPDIGKARRILDFSPKFGLTKGLSLTIDWIKKINANTEKRIGWDEKNNQGGLGKQEDNI